MANHRDWKTLIGQICAGLVVLLAAVIFVISLVLAPPPAPQCLVVPQGWQIVGLDPDTSAYLCVQSATGLYQLDCPVAVVDCP